MIEHINMYRREGMPRHEAMIRGGRERLRPILMTAITTLVGRSIARGWRMVTFRGRKPRQAR